VVKSIGTSCTLTTSAPVVSVVLVVDVDAVDVVELVATEVAMVVAVVVVDVDVVVGQSPRVISSLFVIAPAMQVPS